MNDSYPIDQVRLEKSNDSLPVEPNIVTDFDPDRRELALSYTRVSHRLSLFLMIISLSVAIIILLSRITIIFRDFLYQFISEDPFIVVGIFFIMGFLITSLVELPISLYIFSNLSRKYGLSKLTNKKWFIRYVKGELIGFIIGFPLFEGFYWFLRIFPDVWWFWCTIAVIVFTLIMSFLIPIVFLPRFYKFDPLEDTHPELASELTRLAQEMGVKTTGVFNWRLGEVATVGNAALLGLGVTRRIIIADTILEKYTTDEIKWILAHEIGHFKHHDLQKRLVLWGLTTFFMFLITHILFTPLATLLMYSTAISDVSTIPILGLCFWIINVFFINIPSLWYSRRVERATDRFALTVVSDPITVKSLFIKMADQNLSDIDPPWWEVLFFMSHPSISERIKFVETAGRPTEE